MSSQRQPIIAASVAAFGSAIAIGIAAVGLKANFGYPEIIRAEPGVIMNKLYETKSIVPYLYYFGVGGAGICVLLFSILFSLLLTQRSDAVWSNLGKVCGIISGLLLYVGIIRYSILFPRLATLRHAGTYDPSTIDIVFTALNTYAGESIAEHSQFFFTALMLIFFGISSIKTKILPIWMGVFAFVIAGIDLIGNLEHFGYNFAFVFNRTGPKLFALWMFITGIILIKNMRTTTSQVQ